MNPMDKPNSSMAQQIARAAGVFEEIEPQRKARSPTGLALRRLLRKRLAAAALVVILLFYAGGILAHPQVAGEPS